MACTVGLPVGRLTLYHPARIFLRQGAYFVQYGNILLVKLYVHRMYIVFQLLCALSAYDGTGDTGLLPHPC